MISIESYMHYYAKIVLKEWLQYDFLRIDIEHKLYFHGNTWLISDVVCLTEDGINTIYEIWHKCKLDHNRINKYRIYMQDYFDYEYKFRLYEISAYWIMSQITKPKKLKCKLII